MECMNKNNIDFKSWKSTLSRFNYGLKSISKVQSNLRDVQLRLSSFDSFGRLKTHLKGCVYRLER